MQTYSLLYLQKIMLSFKSFNYNSRSQEFSMTQSLNTFILLTTLVSFTTLSHFHFRAQTTDEQTDGTVRNAAMPACVTDNAKYQENNTTEITQFFSSLDNHGRMHAHIWVYLQSDNYNSHRSNVHCCQFVKSVAIWHYSGPTQIAHCKAYNVGLCNVCWRYSGLKQMDHYNTKHQGIVLSYILYKCKNCSLYTMLTAKNRKPQES